ncbi:tetratricopeptide repeat protein, partial [Nonomuraea sp. NPDC005983]|uniref:tetratricopeptide repeat protein n=1 Tax=Nonomuraea sp. NPDC005983 TaxID=3155595 RepID=UPI0033A49EF9
MSSDQLGAAMRRWEAGELDEAAGLFRAIAATGDPEASHLLACLLEDQGDLDGAEAAHRSVIQSGDPVFGQRSAIAMGMMLVNAREWPAAHRVLTIASDGADFEVAALADTALVLVLTELGDVQGAVEALERARRCDSPAVSELAERLELPDFFPDVQATGTARDRYEAAEDEDDYRALLTCGDPEVVALSAFQLYQLYADEEDFEAAREVCEHAIAVGHPDHLAMAYKLLGAVLVDLGEYAESVAAYARAAEDPRPELRLPALIEQAKVTAQLGDVEATKAIFHRVIASGQQEYALEAQACLAQMHTEAGEVAEALAAVRAVLAAGESEWSSISVTLLGMLLDRHSDAYDEIMELIRAAAEHDDPDAAFKAALLLDHAARQQPLADPVEEQALQDADEALRHLQAGELTEARLLLRRAADSGAATQSIRAMVTLAQLELGEGDRDQADELLAFVAEGDDALQGFTAAFLLHLLRTSGDELHPVLGAVIDHQRLGREEGLVRYRAAMDHPDPSVSAIGTAVFAQVLASIGFELSDAAKLFHAAADSGDPFALAYTATIFKDVLANQDEPDQAIALLRRARSSGHPTLAPWVEYGLGELLVEHDGDLVEAREAYTSAMGGEHRGLRVEAAGALSQLFERQGDLLAACALHEAFVAEADPVRAARNAWLLGLTRVRLDDLAGAAAAFELVPEDHEDQGETGRFARLLLSGDFPGAASAFAPIPDDGRSWMATSLAMQSAHTWQRAGDSAMADGALSLVIEHGHPDFRQEAACYLGALRNDAGDRRGAIAAWEVAAQGDDERLAAVALRALAPTWQRLGEPDAAADAFLRWAQAATDDEAAVTAVLGLGEALVSAGKADEARQVLEEGFGELAPLHLAGFLRDNGDLAAALDAARTAVGSAPSELQGEASWLLGDLLARTGDLAGARASFERAVAADPDSAGSMLLEAGRCLEKAGDADSARSAYQRAAAWEAEPHVAAAARVRLGTATPQERPWVLAAEGDREGALAALTEVTGSARLADLLLSLDAADVPAVRRLLTTWPDGPSETPQGPGDLAGTPESLRAVVETPETGVDPVLDDALAETLEAARARDDDTAKALYRLVIELGTPERSAMGRLGLGELLAADGHHSRAELCYLPATACGNAQIAEMAWRNLAVVRKRRGDLDGAAEALRAAMPATAVPLATLLE